MNNKYVERKHPDRYHGMAMSSGVIAAYQVQQSVSLLYTELYKKMFKNSINCVINCCNLLIQLYPLQIIFYHLPPQVFLFSNLNKMESVENWRQVKRVRDKLIIIRVDNFSVLTMSQNSE